MSSGPTICPGDQIRGAFDPTIIWDELLLSHHVFKLNRINLSKDPLLGDVDLVVARDLDVALCRASSQAPCSAACADGCDD